MNESLSERIDRLIKSTGLSITEFSKAIGVSHSTVSRVVKGTQIPTADTLFKAAQFFKISMEELYVGDLAHDTPLEGSPMNIGLPLESLNLYSLLDDDNKKEVHRYIKYRYDLGLEETTSSTYQSGKRSTTGSQNVG